MDISEYLDYLVLGEKIGSGLGYYRVKGLEGLKKAIMTLDRTCNIEIIHTYEIYTLEPEKLTTGWDIKHIESTDSLVKKYPLFDCVISKNDVRAKESWFSDNDGYNFKENI